MCCEPIEARPEDTVDKCPDCEGDIDKDGDSTEQGCAYSPEVCKTCHWKPCDWSC